MNRYRSLRPVVLGGGLLIAVSATAGARHHVPEPSGIDATCAVEVLYGRLYVTDAASGSFVLEGHGREFLAPPTIDVRAFEGDLVRIDFDHACNVRTIMHAERLEGPMIES